MEGYHIKTDLSEVVERAQAAGVQACLVNTENRAEYERTTQLSMSYPGFLLSCIAVHPVQYDTDENGELIGRSATLTDLNGLDDFYREHAQSIVAIGEVLLHAFDGNLKSARPGIEAGFYFSIPPCAAAPDNKQKEELIKAVPIEQLLLETDSPVLGLNRNERNEPANIVHSVSLIARLKMMSEQQVIDATNQNAHRLFTRLSTLLRKSVK